MPRGAPTDPQIAERLRAALQQGLSLTAAARLVGIPKSTAFSLRARLDISTPADPEATEWTRARLSAFAGELYTLAHRAAQKIGLAISNVEELPEALQARADDVLASHDRDGAAWVRALVGVVGQAIEQAGRLLGKPDTEGGQAPAPVPSASASVTVNLNVPPAADPDDWQRQVAPFVPRVHLHPNGEHGDDEPDGDG